MKKLLLSLLICMGIMTISSQTFAQLDADGAKLKPYNGATYTYTFNGIDQDLEYEFYFSNSANGINKVGEIGAMTGAMTGAAGTVGADKKATVSVTWPSIASTTYSSGLWLFVHVKDTDETTICHNYNAVFIKPMTNNFDVLVTNDLTNDATTSDVCPEFTDFSAVVAPLPAIYAAGTTTMNFTFTRTGSSNEWNLDFDIDKLGTGNYSYSLDGGTTKVDVTGVTLKKSVNILDISASTQSLQIILNNVPGERPEFAITVTSATDDITLIGAKTPNASVLETVKIMPIIGSFN